MTTTKMDMRIDIASRALISVLTGYFKDHPERESIIKAVLVPMIYRRANWIIEDMDDPIIDEQAITVDEKFVINHWKDIRLHCAEAHKFYIVWDSDGIRIGTFEEYQKIPEEKMKPIAVGVMDSLADMSAVIIAQGGQSIVMTWGERLLTSGTIVP